MRVLRWILVATGLAVLGLIAGFVAALLRPQAPKRRPARDASAPATGADAED